jgi:hypothetical protein
MEKASKTSNVSSRRHSQQIVTGDRLDLENYCLHCSLGAEHRRNKLRNEIETAVKRLARRLGNNRLMAINMEQNKDEFSTSKNRAVSVNTPPPDSNQSAHVIHRTITPDIIVSSISSDEDDTAETSLINAKPIPKQQTNIERCSSYPTSGETRLYTLILLELSDLVRLVQPHLRPHVCYVPTIFLVWKFRPRQILLLSIARIIKVL